MDENLARLNRIYPNSTFAKIPPYKPELFEGKKYDSSFDTKAAINRWNTKPLSYDDAQTAVEEGYRVGWIIPQGMVVVDIDNNDDSRTQEYLEKLLEKFEVKYSFNYTSRGIHLIFRDPTERIKTDSHKKCGLNILIDTRANKSGYIVLPCNDPHRAWGDWNDFVEEIPYFLIPLVTDETPSFIGMKEGDGRNNALFKWRTKLEQTHKLKADEVEKCIRIINENLFDTPMPNNELFKTVLRDKDSSSSKTKTLDKENIFNDIAEQIVSKYDIISNGDMYYKFNGSYYKTIAPVDIDRIIHFEVSKNIGKTGRAEIRDFVKVKTQTNFTDINATWYKIACANGILNLITKELEEPNKAEINTIYIPWAYNSDPPYSPLIDNFFTDVTGGDVIKMQFLYQIAGYCLLKKNIFEKFFLFQGEGGTGKSTYTNLLYKLVGDANCSHVSLCDMDKDYYLSSVVDKLLNIDDDVVDGKVLENTGKFKSLVSGNFITVRQIYKDTIAFTPFATCVFSCNRLPRIMDKTSGLFRRIILLELNHKVEKPDPLFLTKVTDIDMEYFLFKAVEGISKAMEEGHFVISHSENQLLDTFKRRQNAINEWIYENDITISELHNNKCSILYRQFSEWCTENGYSRKVTSFTFKEDICALFQMNVTYVTPENGVPYQVFVRHGTFDPKFKPF